MAVHSAAVVAVWHQAEVGRTEEADPDTVALTKAMEQQEG